MASSRELAMRNPALAALMGVGDDDFGIDETDIMSDVGAGVYDAALSDDFGADYSEYSYSDRAFYGGGNDLGIAGTLAGMDDADFAGDNFGADVAVAAGTSAAARAHGATPEGRAIIAKHLTAQARRHSRLTLINPNLGSDVKVGRYRFGATASVTALGTSGSISGSQAPQTHFRPERITCNVPNIGFVLLTTAHIANVAFIVGGTVDAFEMGPNAVDQLMGMEPMTPANTLTFSGSNTTLVPSPLTGTGAFTFIMSAAGPSTVVG